MHALSTSWTYRHLLGFTLQGADLVLQLGTLVLQLRDLSLELVGGERVVAESVHRLVCLFKLFLHLGVLPVHLADLGIEEKLRGEHEGGACDM